MTDMEQISVGEVLFTKLEKSPRVAEIYENILYDYK
jgi:hypothetical protein